MLAFLRVDVVTDKFLDFLLGLVFVKSRLGMGVICACQYSYMGALSNE